MSHWQRFFMAAVLLIVASSAFAAPQAKRHPLRIVVWDERQEAQKQAYDNYLGNQIADFLRQEGAAKNGGQPEFEVKSVGLNEPDQGLSKETLDNCDILLWWGHQKHGEVKDELAQDIVRRIKAGQLSLIALHSAHFSKPFTMAMEARAVQDAERSLKPGERGKVKIVVLPGERRLYGKDERLTPFMDRKPGSDGTETLEVKMPSCGFTGVRADGKPSHIRVLLKNHPIAKGVPETFDIPQTEMYNGPFHVPTPEATLFEEKWDGGEQFLSGSVWNLGAGKVFYFRPGHETFPIFKQPEVKQIVLNTVRYFGRSKKYESRSRLGPSDALSARNVRPSGQIVPGR